ncbi:efflux RND transporter periplasmic adaptor subunit [Aliidiomarina sp. Khilg15.8]
MNWIKKYKYWVLIGLPVVAALVWLARPSPLEVRVSEVRAGHFAETLEEEARTWLRDTYNISAPIQGFLQRVTLDVGDEVEAGDVLFTLEPTPTPALDARAREQARETLSSAQSRLRAAEAFYENAQDSRRQAERELARLVPLFEQGVISETEKERAEHALRQAVASERAAEASAQSAFYDVENARAVLDITEGTRDRTQTSMLQVRSPISGVVLRRERCCEGVVVPGQRVLELGNLQELEVRIDLLSTDAVRVRPGMPVRFERWGGEGTLHGRIERIEPAGFIRHSALGIEERRVAVYARFESEMEEWSRLGENYRLDAVITLWESDDVVSVPLSALVREQGEWHVFLMRDGRAILTPVETGRRSGLQQQIHSGVRSGDQVVDHPPANLTNGQRITEAGPR